MASKAGIEKRRLTEPRNTVRMALAATADSTFEWREVWAQVKASFWYPDITPPKVPTLVEVVRVGRGLFLLDRRHKGVNQSSLPSKALAASTADQERRPIA